MEIEHNQKSQRFYIEFGENEASLTYNLDNNILEILSVNTPPELREKGLAEKITLYAFNYAKENNLKVKPTCPYVKNKFLKDHHEFDDLLV